MSRICLLIFLAALALLAGCSKQDMLQKFSTPEDQRIAKEYIDRLRARDFAPIESALDQSMQRPGVPTLLARMADLIPAQEPTSIKLVGAQRASTPEAKTVNTTYEYQFGEKWLLINVATQVKKGAKTIVGFHVQPEAKSLEAQNKFTLQGKTLARYSILALAIVIPLFILYALITCIRTKIHGKKWPWVLFIIFGVGRLSLNWSTGAWAVSIPYVQLFGASAVSQLYGPVIISISLPAGAIAFLWIGRRREMQRVAIAAK